MKYKKSVLPALSFELPTARKIKENIAFKKTSSIVLYQTTNIHLLAAVVNECKGLL